VINQGHDARVSDPTREQAAQDLVIDAREKLNNVALEDIAIAPRELLGAVDRAMGALADPQAKLASLKRASKSGMVTLQSA
jgi:hypothetical protein